MSDIVESESSSNWRYVHVTRVTFQMERDGRQKRGLSIILSLELGGLTHREDARHTVASLFEGDPQYAELRKSTFDLWTSGDWIGVAQSGRRGDRRWYVTRVAKDRTLDCGHIEAKKPSLEEIKGLECR